MMDKNCPKPTTPKPKNKGGRPKGSLSKQTREVRDKLAELGCDPFEGLAKIALDMNNSPELRARVLTELATYIAPKRKAIEVSGPGGDQIQISWLS